ncbi:S-layer family protein, partial [Shewanella sp. UCD-KL12]|uniref:beta strand repeat-containing protein n=1 Tax=Shewanella sp. UCD-KL12 TaxID=1917163 RepID=UPI00117D21E5
ALLGGNVITHIDNNDGLQDSDGGDGGTLTVTHVDGVLLVFDQDGWSQDFSVGNGTLRIKADGTFEYQHDGSDPEQTPPTFDYTLSDGVDSDDATVTITTNAVNDGPFAEDDSFTVDEGALLGGNVITHIDNNDGLQDSDGGDGGTLTVTHVDGVLLVFGQDGWSQDFSVGNGTLRIKADGTFEYQHDGSDPEQTPPTFDYTLSDGVDSDDATVTITTNAVNDGPFAEDDSFTVDEGALLGGNVITHIDNNDGLQDSDGGDGGTLTVTHVDGVLLVFDQDGWSQDFSVGNGTLRIKADGTFEYQHDGSDPEQTPPTFDYTLSDGVDSDDATVTITTNAVNDGPFAEDDSFTVDEGALLGGNVITHIDNNDGLQDSDGGDGGTLTVTHVDGVLLVFDQDGWSQDFSVGNGTLRIKADGTFEYQHDGSDPEQTPPTFDYTLSDGADTDDATVTITTNAVNDGPFAEDDSFTVDEGALLSGNIITHIDNNDGLQDSDGGDGGTLTVTHVDGVLLVFDQDGWSQDFSVGNGTLRIKADGTFEYQHDGSDPEQTPPTFDYTLSDGVDSDDATVTITINAVNDGPFAEDDSFTVDEGALLGGNVITHIDNNDGLQDSDGGDGGTLTVTHVDGVLLVFDQDGWSQDFSVGNGTLRIKADGTFEYQHDGSDPEQTPPTFDYTLSDGSDTDDATVTITTNPINDEPEITDIDPITVSEEGLTHGLIDNVGNPSDSTNLTIVNGTLVFTDLDNGVNDFTVSVIDIGSIPATTSNGVSVVWSWDAGSNTLTGSAGNTDVITIVFDSNFNQSQANNFSLGYTVTLLAAIDHTGVNIEDLFNLEFTVNINDGDGGNASTTLNVTIEDDSPIDELNSQELHIINNTINETVSGDLFATGADGVGSINLSVVEGQNLTHNGVALNYVTSNDGATVTAMAGNIEVFIIEAVSDNNGGYDYQFTLLQEIDIESLIVFNLSDFPAGNNGTYDVGPDGTIYSHDGSIDNAIAVLSSNGSVNSNNSGIGVDNPVISAGEILTITYLNGGTTHALISMGAGVNEGQRGGETFVTYTVYYANGTNSGPLIAHINGEVLDLLLDAANSNIISVDITYSSGDDFQITGLSAASSVEQDPLDIHFTYSAGDADQDPVFDNDGEGEFTITLVPDAHTVQTGTTGADVLTGDSDSDYLAGGLGDDTLNADEGGDILIGGLGSDSLDLGIDLVEDTALWLSEDADGSTDTVYNFNVSDDALDLADMLVGEDEDASVLDDYLDFNFVNGNTEISIDADNDGDVDLTIIIDSVDLTNGGVLATDIDIINSLLAADALVVDTIP